MDITIKDGVSGIISDTYVHDSDPWWNYNHGASINFITGRYYQMPLLRVDLSSLSGVIPISSSFSVLQNSGVNNAYMYWYEVYRDWGEGNKTGSLASAGESTWLSAKKGSDDWEVAGCNGDTDRNSVWMGRSYRPYNLNTWRPMNVSLDATQRGLDKGWLSIFMQNTTKVEAFYSSENIEGRRPYFYMEYTYAPEPLKGNWVLGRFVHTKS